MNWNEMKIVVSVSTIVSFTPLLIGIFIRAGIELPLQGLSYGLIYEMFQDPKFLGFHFNAFVWFFLASIVSSSIVLHYVKKSGKNT